jgi:conjugal transfer pilus assembly protein TraW
MRNTLLALMFGLTACVPAVAKDLGVQGQIWPVIEIDFRRLMLESAARADWNQVQDEVKASADRYFDSFPRRYLPSIDKTTTHYIDPSVTVSSDIMAPIPDAAGNYQWTKLYAKGTKVNPLEKYRPLTAMLFFDGSDEDQLKFVKEALAANPMRIVPVETAGANVKTLSDKLDRPVFYANESMMARFKVRNLPSLLYPASGEYSMYLGMTAFATPYKYAELEAVWPAKAARTDAPAVYVPTVTEQERSAITNLLKIPPKAEPNAKNN